MQFRRSQRISVAVFTLLTPMMFAFQNCSPTSLSTTASTQGGPINNDQSSGEPATGNTGGTGSSGGTTTPPTGDGGSTGGGVPVSGSRSAYIKIEAESFDSQQGFQVVPNALGYASVGDYAVYNNIDFGSAGAKSIKLSIGAPANVAGRKFEIHLGSAAGELISEVTVQSTGGYSIFKDQSVNLNRTVTGLQNVVLVMKGDDLADIDAFTFSTSAVSTTPPVVVTPPVVITPPVTNVEAEKFPLPSPTAANVYVVDPINGNDASDGSDARPWKTIKSHFSQINSPGKTLFLKNGTHAFTGTLFNFCGGSNGYRANGGGAPGSPVIIAAYPGHKPVVDGQFAEVSRFMFFCGVSHVVVSGLKVINLWPSWDGAVTAIGNTHDIIFEFNEFDHIGNTHYFDHVFYLGGIQSNLTGDSQGQWNWIVRNNKANDISGSFFKVSSDVAPSNGHDLKVENNIVTDTTWGVLIGLGGNYNITIQNNTFYNVGLNRRVANKQTDPKVFQYECSPNPCAGAGVDLDLMASGAPTRNIVIRGNVIMAGAGQRAFISRADSGFVDQYNIWGSVDNQASPMSYPASNQYVTQPRLSVQNFINSSGRVVGSRQESPSAILNSNLSLKAGSSAIDLAITSILKNDFYGNPRKNSPDAGAVEY